MIRCEFVGVLGVPAACVLSMTAWAADCVTVPRSAMVKKPAFAYRTGGPLAGVELPPYPTYFGEPAGKPGNSKGIEYQLYPGGVEHYRHGEMRLFGKNVPKFDIQSQLYRFTAPEIPGCTGQSGRYAQPIHKIGKYNDEGPTGNCEPEVDVKWCGAGDTVLAETFDLPRGVYCVRMVGASKTEDQLTPVRKTMIGEFEVTKGEGRGQRSRSTMDDRSSQSNNQTIKQSNNSPLRRHMNYMAQFYSMGEFFFHVDEAGPYTVRFTIAKESEVEIAVRDVLVEDALTGVDVRPIKKKSQYDGAIPVAEVERIRSGVRAMDAQKRRKLEDTAWNSVWTRTGDSTWAHRTDANVSDRFFNGVPVECLKDLSGLEIDTNFNAVTARSFIDKYGQWRWRNYGFENEKLRLRYSMEDLLAGRPIPAPYPLPWNEFGISAVRGDHEKLVLFRPFNFDLSRNNFYRELFQIDNSYFKSVGKKDLAKRWTSDHLYAHLVSFVRLAYEYPTLDTEMTEVGYQRLKVGPWSRGALAFRTTYGDYLSWYTEYQNYLILYDKLFPLIQGNVELAEAVGRFVPWVKTPEDVISIFDGYMVQDIVKRCMRHHYYWIPGSVLTANRVLNYDAKLTDDFAKWSFSSEFRYPVYGGLQYIMQNNLDRAGTAPSSTSSYVLGENGLIWSQELLNFSIESGEKTYMFQNAARYPKFKAALDWYHDFCYAGWQFPRIGDVSGPDREAWCCIVQSRPLCEAGWKYWKDPVSAVYLYRLFGETNDVELAAAAKRFDRMPYFALNSRMIPNWCGILELGKRHDDFRFRNALMVRAGRHYGHSHADSLDLQVVSHGLLYTVDGGQRPGYTKPGCFNGRIHCTVTKRTGAKGEETKDDKGLRDENGCISAIADGEHFASLTARAGRGRSVRHVSLVAVDDDGPAMKLPIEKQLPNVKLDPAPKTPNAYVFDVFREKTRGGKLVYNFHAANNAEKDFRREFGPPRTSAPTSGRDALVASAPSAPYAEWKLLREPEMENGKMVNMAYEPFQLGVNFDPKSPRKCLRLHLANLDKSATMETERYNDYTRGNRMTMLHVVEDAPEGKVFAAVIEPYEGTPFVKRVKALQVDGAKGAWDDPVGVVVETTDGQRNLHLSAVAGGSGSRPYQFNDSSAGSVLFEGGNAFVNYDAKGLRRAVLTGGTRLVAPGLSISAAAAAFTGTVVKVDYAGKSLLLDCAWDLSRICFPKIIHVTNGYGLDTSFTVTGGKTKNGRTALRLKETANVYISDIREISPSGQIFGKQPVFMRYDLSGCTLVNTARTKFWKNKSGNSIGATKPTLADFPDNLFSAWEYGPGDTVTMEATTTVERQAAGAYMTVSDVSCETVIK